MKGWRRSLKNRRFFSPPLVGSDLTALGLKSRDTVKTPVSRHLAQARATITYPGIHMLALRVRLLPGSEVDKRNGLAYRIYWGIMPHGGATAEEASGTRHYLRKEPVFGEDLPHSRSSTHRKVIFDFPGDDSGKTAFFSVRLENARNQECPWGPLFSAILP